MKSLYKKETYNQILITDCVSSAERDLNHVYEYLISLSISRHCFKKF